MACLCDVMFYYDLLLDVSVYITILLYLLSSRHTSFHNLVCKLWYLTGLNTYESVGRSEHDQLLYVNEAKAQSKGKLCSIPAIHG